MSTTAHIRHIITTGLAMFSMFFGAGNIVFPLIVGQQAGNMVSMALVGLMFGAVIIPFIGLLAMTYYDGNHKEFFSRIGVWPGYLVTLFIMILIGPINAIPRCVALSYGTIKMYAPGLSGVVFSIIACLIIFAATVRKSRIVDLLGDLLSPLLVVCLFLIIIKGLWTHPAAPASSTTAGKMLLFGLTQGYNTMDLLGTFFFSGVTIAGLKQLFPHEKSPKVIAYYALQSSIIGAGLLGAVYVGFGLVASYYGSVLGGMDAEVLLGTVAHMVLGKAGGFVVSMAVALACLTTAITLAVVFSEFLQEQVFAGRVRYEACLVATLITTGVFANFGFTDIVAMMVPILMVVYPALIVLTVVNMLHKTVGFRFVKAPVVIATGLSFAWYHLPSLAQAVTAFLNI